MLRYHLTLGIVYFSADTAVRYLCCQALAKVYGHRFLKIKDILDPYRYKIIRILLSPIFDFFIILYLGELRFEVLFKKSHLLYIKWDSSMRWFSGLFSILGFFIAYYPKKKNGNPDWYIKRIGDWPSVSTLVFRPENLPSLLCGNPPPPSLNTVLLHSERIGPLSSTPSTVGCFPPPPVPRAGYVESTLLLFDTQCRSYTSVVVWNLYCDRNSDRQVSCCRNLRRFKQINNHDIYTTQ